MARREPITDVHLRELALKRFQKTSPEPAPPLSDSLKKVMDEIPADRGEATINALYEEIELYRTNKLISQHEGPDSVAESLRERVDKLKRAQPAILEIPAIPHASTLDVCWYYAAHDALQGVINAAEVEIKRLNGQVSPGKARQLNTRQRNDLAIGLKGIGIGLLGKDERAAEKWVERVFDALKQDHPDPSDPLHVMYPDSSEHPGDFKRMFAVTVCRTPPPDHLANVLRWRRAFARQRLAEELYQQELGRLRKEG